MPLCGTQSHRTSLILRKKTARMPEKFKRPSPEQVSGSVLDVGSLRSFPLSSCESMTPPPSLWVPCKWVEIVMLTALDTAGKRSLKPQRSAHKGATEFMAVRCDNLVSM